MAFTFTFLDVNLEFLFLRTISYWLISPHVVWGRSNVGYLLTCDHTLPPCIQRRGKKTPDRRLSLHWTMHFVPLCWMDFMIFLFSFFIAASVLSLVRFASKHLSVAMQYSTRSSSFSAVLRSRLTSFTKPRALSKKLSRLLGCALPWNWSGGACPQQHKLRSKVVTKTAGSWRGRCMIVALNTVDLSLTKFRKCF